MENTQVNIVDTITQTINNLFSNLFSSIDNSLYSVLDDLLFINSDIFADKYIEKVLGTSSLNGMILICNSLLIGFFLYYVCFLILSYFTFSQIQRPSQFVFKLLLCAMLMNFSGTIMQKLIDLFCNISLSIREVGEIVYSQSICLSTFIQKFNSTVYLESSGFNVFSLNGLVKGYISISLLNLSFSYALRYIMIKVFILLFPFAIISLINPSTSWIFKSWSKLFLSLLFLQVFVPLILLVSFSIDGTSSDTFSKIIYIGSVYALIKANTFVGDFMGGLSTDINIGISNFKNFFST